MSKQFDNFMKLKKAHELISEVQDDLKNNKVAKKISYDLFTLMALEFSCLRKPLLKTANQIIALADMTTDESQEEVKD